MDKPLPPIERDEHMDRTYIPIPGGWEIQTKGKGSSFRICNVKTGDRWLISEEHIHQPLVDMAMAARAAVEQPEVMAAPECPSVDALVSNMADTRTVFVDGAYQSPLGATQFMSAAALLRGSETDWQPIETAPKTFSPPLSPINHHAPDILGLWGKAFYCVCSWGGPSQPYWIDSNNNKVPFQPTHWMPLPKPPET